MRCNSCQCQRNRWGAWWEVYEKNEKWCARLCFKMLWGQACCVLIMRKGVENNNVGWHIREDKTNKFFHLKHSSFRQMHGSKSVHGNHLVWSIWGKVRMDGVCGNASCLVTWRKHLWNLVNCMVHLEPKHGHATNLARMQLGVCSTKIHKLDTNGKREDQGTLFMLNKTWNESSKTP